MDKERVTPVCPRFCIFGKALAFRAEIFESWAGELFDLGRDAHGQDWRALVLLEVRVETEFALAARQG